MMRRLDGSSHPVLKEAKQSQNIGDEASTMTVNYSAKSTTKSFFNSDLERYRDPGFELRIPRCLPHRRPIRQATGIIGFALTALF